MNGFDILLDKAIPHASMAAALAKVFGTPLGRVSVVVGVEEYPAIESADVVCVLSVRQGGQFFTQASIDSRKGRVVDSVSAVRSLSNYLNCNCLLSDLNEDPYVMQLVQPDGSMTQVSLDTAALDERDEYVLEGT